MNTLIRHLASLISRLLSEVRDINKRLVNLPVNIRKMNFQPPIKPVGKTDRSKEEEQKSVADASTNLHIPEAIITEWEKDGDEKANREYIAIIVSILTFGALLAYTIVNYHMLDQMETANRSAEKSFIKTLGQMQAQTVAQQTAANAQACAAIAAGKAAKAMSDQVSRFDTSIDIAREQIRIFSRPYVTIDDQENGMRTKDITFNNTGLPSMHYDVILRDFGGGGAQNVMSIGELVLSNKLNDMWDSLNEACGPNFVGNRDVGHLLFPGRKAAAHSTSAMDINAPKKNGDGIAYPGWFVFCIGYRDQFDYLYRTKIVFRLVDQSGHNKSIQVSSNQVVPAKWIEWYSSFDSGIKEKGGRYQH